MALVVFNMEVVGNVIGCIIWGLWIVLIFVNMYSNHKNEKSNAELMREIHKSNELNKKSIDEVQKYYDTTNQKATAQDNFLWESIIILAKKIHDLGDNNYVK